LAQAGPFAILAAGALWLRSHRDQLPAMVPLHWSARFEPDSFAPRDSAAVALPLLLGLIVCLILFGFQAGLRRSASQGPLRDATLGILLVGEYFSALVCCGLLAASASDGRLLKPVLALSFLGVLALLVLTWLGLRRVPREPARNPSAWKGGLFYVDKADPALFVPKRSGLGYTFNFGHPWALPLTVLLLGVPLAVGLAAMFWR